jgi:hypothetical protein
MQKVTIDLVVFVLLQSEVNRVRSDDEDIVYAYTPFRSMLQSLSPIRLSPMEDLLARAFQGCRGDSF